MSDFIPGGCSTYSKQQNRFPANYPPYLMAGNGCVVRGSDSRTYLDLISGLGAIFLGYQHPAVDQAVLRQLRAGTLFSLRNPIEGEVAQQFCEMTGWDQVRWGKNGSDATEAAVRLARSVTGRDMILTMGGYHGYHSDLVTSQPGKEGGILDRCKHSLMEWNGDYTSLRGLAPQCAALIVEPITYEPIPIWEEIKASLVGTGCLLIFDEVITGFRYAAGGAAAYLDVRPDLACYGKALGNGMPIAAIAGDCNLMCEFEERVFFSGTYGAECLSLAAAGAVMKVLAHDADLYGRLWEAGSLLQKGFNDRAQTHGVDAQCVGLPPRTQFRFRYPAQREQFCAAMVEQGVLVGRDNFLTVAHTVSIVEKILTACAMALDKIAEKGKS